MINKLKIFFNKIIIKFLINFKNNNSLYFETEELNFRLIYFNNKEKLKSIYLNFKEINTNIKDDKTLLFHSFEWLNYSKKLGA